MGEVSYINFSGEDRKDMAAPTAELPASLRTAIAVKLSGHTAFRGVSKDPVKARLMALTLEHMFPDVAEQVAEEIEIIDMGPRNPEIDLWPDVPARTLQVVPDEV